jgi:uncharacterized protein (DUF1697 family)
MGKYVAFLRGINVSGQKLIKMEALRKAFTETGFADVKTYIQSGNVIFESDVTDTKKLNLLLEGLIEKSFGFRTDVILRTHSDIESILNSLQISREKLSEERKYYITFLKEAYSEPFTIPLFSKNKDVEVIYHNRMEFVSISTLYKGQYGFPNAYIEKLTGIPATTRNPLTLGKILEL